MHYLFWMSFPFIFFWLCNHFGLKVSRINLNIYIWKHIIGAMISDLEFLMCLNCYLSGLLWLARWLTLWLSLLSQNSFLLYALQIFGNIMNILAKLKMSRVHWKKHTVWQSNFITSSNVGVLGHPVSMWHFYVWFNTWQSYSKMSEKMDEYVHG